MRTPALLRSTAAAFFVAILLGPVAPAGKSAAAEQPIRWKMASAFPGELVQLGSLGVSLQDKLERISGGDIQLKFFEPFALVPPLELFDAVSSGSIEAAWSTPGYWFAKEKALALFSSVPFGPSAPEYAAWIYHGGGRALMDEVYAKHDIKSLVCGVTAPEASGWFREEITTLEDLKGLKIRFLGLGAAVMERLGVTTKQLAGGDIYAALEQGTIDASEYSMPAIDLDLGFHHTAKHYYFPGWHQQSTLFELMINKDAWDALSNVQRAQIEIVCGDNFREGLAQGEAIQGEALAELRRQGVTLHRWPPEILDSLHTAWNELAAEWAAEDSNFKRTWESLQAFRAEYALWKDLGYLN